MSDPIAQQPVPANITNPHPGIYFNGFGLAVGSTDISVILLNGNFQVGVIQAPPAVIKQMGNALLDSVAQLEKLTGVTYPPLSELLDRMSEHQKNG